MPRDVFVETADGRLAMQAWESFPLDVDEQRIPHGELHILMTEEQALEFERALRELMPRR